MSVLFPGSYLPASYYASSYGGKVGAGEDGEKPSRSSPSVKSSSEAKALDLLQQHASQYKSKSPSIQDSKMPHDREREREGDRPRSSPSQRILPSHHHLGYPLYDLSYPSGEARHPDFSEAFDPLYLEFSLGPADEFSGQFPTDFGSTRSCPKAGSATLL